MGTGERTVKAIDLERQMADVIEIKNDSGAWELVADVRVARIKSDVPAIDGLRVVAVFTDQGFHLYGTGKRVAVRDRVRAPDN